MTGDIKTSSRPSFSNLRYPKVLMVLGFAGLLLLYNIVRGNFGVLGQDSDDLLRFMQIRDYLRGQSWFDTDQYRMGLTAAGTDMHWSRLPDIPIILLTHVFDIFTSQDKALDLAISVWPPLSGMIVVVAMLIGAEQIEFNGNRKYLRVFTALLVALFVISNTRFQSGAIDHHNVQFGFIALAMVWAMDRQLRASRYFLAALATAICIAIGPEVYLFAAVICGFVALNWAVQGPAANRAAQGFGLGLAFGIAVIFFATVPPASYGVIYCDALSLITVTAAICGGLGLALTAKTSRYYGGEDSFIRRVIALAVLGGFCLTVLSFQAPNCLSNPLKSLPPDVTELWLGYITEAAPLYKLNSDWMMFIPVVIGAPLTALCVIMHGYYKRFKVSHDVTALWDLDLLMTLLLLTAMALTIYQIRFSPFATMFSILILVRWTASSYEKGLLKGGTNIKYIFCTALSIPIIWAMPGLLFQTAEGDTSADEGKTAANGNTGTDAEKTCESEELIAALNRLPTGLIVANSNSTGEILIQTAHSAVSGNYHRNWAGISAEIKIAISSLEEAHSLLTEHKVDYFYHCKLINQSRYSNYNSDGLAAHLEAGTIPDFLVPAFDEPVANGDALVFKVIPKP